MGTKIIITNRITILYTITITNRIAVLHTITITNRITVLPTKHRLHFILLHNIFSPLVRALPRYSCGDTVRLSATPFRGYKLSLHCHALQISAQCPHYADSVIELLLEH